MTVFNYLFSLTLVFFVDILNAVGFCRIYSPLTLRGHPHIIKRGVFDDRI